MPPSPTPGPAPSRRPELPEPYATALSQGRARDVVDQPAASSLEHYARALAAMQCGREDMARSDLEAAIKAFGDDDDDLADLCRVERALLDIRVRQRLTKALKTAEAIAARSRPGHIRGRANHVLGLALGKMRKTGQAITALLAAQSDFLATDDRANVAQVQDTLGMVLAATGRLDQALTYYSLSLVHKSLQPDRYGMAITLGNMGRVHLRAGRFDEAIACLGADLEIARDLDDNRGAARVQNDLARVEMGRARWDRALVLLEEGLAIATRCHYEDLEFFVQKDIALTRIGRARQAADGKERKAELDAAAAALDAAEHFAVQSAEPYLGALTVAARGEWHLAVGTSADLATATQRLEEAADRFGANDLPDLEIPTLILLAEAHLARRFKASAERCLLRANRLARADGYARYLPGIREAMGRLALCEGLLDERWQAPVDGRSPLPNNYQPLERLGEGGFGEVWKAFDVERNRVVAFKRLTVSQTKGTQTKGAAPSKGARAHGQFLASIRRELEATARIRHPQIARAHAVGEDPDGVPYVVTDFIPGHPLSSVMIDGRHAEDTNRVIRVLQQIAHALVHLHDVGVVHRDLKPHNVILRDEPGRAEQPVLIDFGIALVDFGRESREGGVVHGTPEYMAPEQVRGGKVTGAADVYSLAVIAYRWLTGRSPIQLTGLDTAEAVRKILKAKPEPIQDHLPLLPTELQTLLGRMLDKKPSGRPLPVDVRDTLGLMLAMGKI